MANHLYTRAGGVWNTSTDLLASELADLDAKTVDSLSGTGGTYALVDPLTIGGAPGTFVQLDVQLDLTDLLFMTGGIEAYGAALFGGSGDFVVDKFSQFTSLAEFLGETQFHSDASFYDDTFFNDDVTTALGTLLDVYGDATFHAGATFSDVAHCDAGADFGGQATFYEQAVFQKIILLTGEARIPQRQAIGGDADATYQAKTYTHVHVPAGTLTANHNYTIGDTGAVDGDRIRFSTTDDGFGIVIKAPGGSTLTTIKGDLLTWIDAERVQGTWTYVRGHSF